MDSMKDIAVSAANCYRAIDALVGEFEKIKPENPHGINLFDRFLLLHAEFYGHILTLTAEESGVIDAEFKREIEEESQKLQEVIQFLKKDKGFIEALTGKIVGRSNQMSDYFAHCVADIFEGYDIDTETNQIFFIDD